MRTILLNKADESYLKKCAQETRFAYGIIIGQQSEKDKYIVVHLAKNVEEEVDLPHYATQDLNGAEDINTQALTSQWISASKMIPGSFKVLGVFFASADTNILDEDSFKSARNLLNEVQNILIQGNNYCGFIDDVVNADYLLLAYSSSAKAAVCKSYSHSSNSGTFTPMDCRFVDKAFEWLTFETNFELDDVFPILDNTQKINIENEFQKTIIAVKHHLEASEIFIQNESIDDKMTLDAYIKQKKTSRKGLQEVHKGPFKATIYLPVKCQISNNYPIKVREFNGTIRFSGIISSRIWCNKMNTIGEIKKFVADDILRSLAARIQVYCDGLTDPNMSNEAIFISEPPRRVYFHLTTAITSSPIQFSDYIFRGEAPTVAVAQAKQILDLDINTENIITDVEGLPDDDTFSDSSSELLLSPSQPITERPHDITRSMYLLGIVVSILVLLLSVLVHYILKM